MRQGLLEHGALVRGLGRALIIMRAGGEGEAGPRAGSGTLEANPAFSRQREGGRAGIL
jgi:hypothetical protein